MENRTDTAAALASDLADMTREFGLIRNEGLDLAGYLRFRRVANGLPRLSRSALNAWYARFEDSERASKTRLAVAADRAARMLAHYKSAAK